MTRKTLMILSTSALVALSPALAAAQSNAGAVANDSPVAADAQPRSETNEAEAAQDQTRRLLEDATDGQTTASDEDAQQTGTTEMTDGGVTDEEGNPQPGTETAQGDASEGGVMQDGVTLPTQDGQSETAEGGTDGGMTATGGDSSQTAGGEGVMEQGVTLPGQDGSSGDSQQASGETSGSGSDVQQTIRQADAPRMGVTEDTGQPVAGSQMTAEQGATSPGRAMPRQTMAVDVETFAQRIYERAYSEGYAEGVADARRQVLQELAARRQQAMREEMMQQQRQADMMNRRSSSGMGQDGMRQGMGQSGGQSADAGQGRMQQPQQQQSAQGQVPGEAQDSEVAAQNSGSIIVLPQGMTIDEFLDQVRSAQR